MPEVVYRLYFGDRPATEEELDRIEEITVEQEMDMAWEARVKLSLCLDDEGRWRREPEEGAEPFSRVRIELKLGTDPFEPLIDGPVVAYDNALDSQPGRSAVTLVVRDDSVLMNREEGIETYENRSDDAIASQIFEETTEIAETRVQSTTGTSPVTVRRGTPIQFLRNLAYAHEYHAYVLPGSEPGRSIGCFLPDPEGPGGLPPLRLLGTDRNLEDVTVAQDNEGPERTQAHTLRITDQQIVSAERSGEDETLLSDLPPIAVDQTALRQLRPEDNDREDPEPRAAAQARRSSYAYRVTGRVLPACYPAILTPYEKVRLLAGNLPISGDYLLTKVRHQITHTAYSQEFEAKGDSGSDVSGDASSAAAAGLSVEFSASLSVF